MKGQGSKTQVVLAGGVAGLVSRFVHQARFRASLSSINRFCIAPLDVVKIRLQLQSHSLSDPLTKRNVTGPIYKGTLPTLKAILEQEGITVRIVRLMSRA